MAQCAALIAPYVLFGAVASAASLVLYGLINRSDVALTLALIPAIGLGTLLGDSALKRLTIKSLQPFTLGISTFAAIILLLRALW